MYNHVAHFYGLDLNFSDKENKLQHLENMYCKHYNFLWGISKTHQQLSSLTESEIFDISKDQKQSLNQFIYFTKENWDER